MNLRPRRLAAALAMGAAVVATGCSAGSSATDAMRTAPSSPVHATAVAAVRAVPTASAQLRGWASGVYAGHGIDTAAAQAFGTWRGSTVDVATVFTDRSSWAAFAGDLWCVQQYRDFPGRLSIAVPLTLGDTTLAEVAAGAADRWFTAYARHLAALGRRRADLRLGWDFDLASMPWHTDRARTYVAAFRRVSRLLTTVLPDATIDWDGSWGRAAGDPDPFELYPGDDVVDVVGLDVFDDGWVAADSAARFRNWAAADHGLDAWLAFARRHHKRFAVPQWGLHAAGRDHDDPTFVSGMHAFFTAHARELAYEAYFDDDDSALRGRPLVRSAATYRRLWHEAS
ncbi:MAG: hypothetical protein ACTHMS_11025 [Jatrophihabitans sp.]|uniref:hypothetical protein n=1 Tax=Jatrophihabitans sp. TaxID=1932789 RepID=UPI003F7DAC8F